MYPPRLSRPRYLQQTTGLCKAEKPHRSKEAKAPALFLRMDWVLVILNATIVENIYISMDPYILITWTTVPWRIMNLSCQPQNIYTSEISIYWIALFANIDHI